MLAAPAMTSAGVFNADQRLVRTLWSGRALRGGPVHIDWDGHDEDGQAVPTNAHYRVRLLAHNVRYQWQGVIGNSSREFTGVHVHRAFEPINDMAFDAAGHGFYVVGYDEQQHAIHRFDVRDAQQQTVMAHDDYRRVYRYVATDGKLAYFANIGLMAPATSDWREPSTFVVGLDVEDGSQHHFPAGRVDMPGAHWGSRWDSVIDYDRDDVDVDGAYRSAPSGLAVQQQGSLLFVAHQRLNQVRVLDKRTGAPLDRIDVPEPTGLCVAPDDSLWVLSGAGAMHFRQSEGHWVEVGRVTAGLQHPVAIGVSPRDGTVVIADAGSEQLKAFDPQGVARWTFGQANAYRDRDPTVDVDRLWLSAGPTYVAFEADGSFWVGDPGNARDLHLTGERQYLDQITYLPHNYHVAVDFNHPQRVFDRFLEFTVDYARPLQDSWRLTRNWAAGLDTSYIGDLDGLYTVVTLGNGRTYATAARYAPPKGRWSEVVELTAAGIRAAGMHLDFGQKLYADGSLRWQSTQGGALTIYERRCTGFDGQGNPIWAPAERIGGIDAVQARDPYWHDVPLVAGLNETSLPSTERNVVVTFNPGTSAGFHLGGITRGSNRWLWRSSPSGSWSVDGKGEIESPDGTFELGRGVQYPGNVVVTAGRQIVYGYHGEAWNGGEADQWIHYLDDGLFVGQFGEPVYPAANRLEARAGAAGNSFSPQLVEVEGRLYLWANDESVHGGIHRWRIDGIHDIHELEADITP